MIEWWLEHEEGVNIGCHRSDAGYFMPDRSRSASRQDGRPNRESVWVWIQYLCVARLSFFVSYGTLSFFLYQKGHWMEWDFFDSKMMIR
jgi:hypothetical protein